MSLPALRPHNAPQKRPDWMPDPGVLLYVRDMLYQGFGVEVDALPSHWIPLTIVGVLDWIVICQWWIFRNTGVFESDDPYKFVFDYQGYEFDPDQLLVFREDAERHKFQERIQSPGINGKERSEALPFLSHDVFASWMQQEQDMSEEQAEAFIPPVEFFEIAMWATFMWVLDEYGRDWIYMQDDLIACVFDFGVAYYSRWDESLLDPKIMVCTQRPRSSCKYCEQTLWCVAGTSVDAGWQFVCNHCLVALASEGTEVDTFDRRAAEPSCPHLTSTSGRAGTCMATCPHSGNTPEKLWTQAEEQGSARVDAYREAVKAAGGLSPRQMSGQSLRDIVQHFGKALPTQAAPPELEGEE